MRTAPFAALVFALLVMSAVPVGTTHVTSTQSSQTRWTIMMYMADDATPDLPWSGNIHQMEAANQTDGTNVIALVDPLGSGNSQLLKVEHGGAVTVADSFAVIPPGGEVNMASPNTLSSFIRFSAANYPADRYVLILWGHGAGWEGMCPDGADILTLGELKDALSNATDFMGRPLDLIGVDSCAEANFEMLYEIL